MFFLFQSVGQEPSCPYGYTASNVLGANNIATENSTLAIPVTFVWPVKRPTYYIKMSRPLRITQHDVIQMVFQ